MSIDIRPLSLEHVDEALALLHPMLGADHTGKAEILRRMGDNTGVFYVAVDMALNKIVGVKFGYIDDNRALGRGVAVLPDYRRRGIGRRLYQAFEDALRSRNDVNFYVFASATPEGVPFHIANGYRPQVLIQLGDQALREQIDLSGFHIATEHMNKEFGVYQVYAELDDEQQNLAYLRRLQAELPQANVLFLFSKPMK